MAWYSLNTLVAGARAANESRFIIPKVLTLNELTDDPVANGIFHRLRSFPWNQLQAQSEALNMDYYFNVSGDKIASKYLQQVAVESTDEDTGEVSYSIPTDVTARLGLLATMRFKAKWENLWKEYAIQPWFDNVSLLDVTEGVETSNESNSENTQESSTDSQDRRDIHSGGFTDSSVGSDNSTAVRSGSVKTDNTGIDTDTNTESGQRVTTVEHEGTVNDKTNSNAKGYTYGYDSTEEGVPANKSVGDDDTTRTYNNKDTTTENPKKVDTRTLEHGLTTTQKYDNITDAQSATASADTKRVYDNETKTRALNAQGTRNSVSSGNTNISRTNAITHKFSGMDYRRQDRLEHLIKMFENPNLFPFFQIVYEDLDELLVIPVFK